MTESDLRGALRHQMRARRHSLPARDRLRAAEALGHHLLGFEPYTRARQVAGYWAVRGELSLHALFAARPRPVYCLPCLGPDASLRFAPWRPGQALLANRYGIPEPAVAVEAQLSPGQLDLVLLPLLAFDRHGTRLGSGGGYYDRSFAFLREQSRPARPLLVGVGYAFQQVEHLPAAAWDVALDYVVTEAGLIRCVARAA